MGAPLPVNQQPQQPPPKPNPWWMAFAPQFPSNPFQPTEPPGGSPGPFGGPLPSFADAETGFRLARRQILNSVGGPTGAPIPLNTPGGGFEYDKQRAGEFVAAPFAGAALMGTDALIGMAQLGQGVQNYFTGTGFVDPRLQPSAPLPVPDKLPPGMPVNPNAPAGTDITNMPGLDGTTVIQGAGLMPKAPTLQLPENFNPDYTKADARLDAGRPKVVKPKGTESQAGWLGAAEAAGRIDPYETHWSQALAQVVGGYAKGQENFRLRQEEAEMRAEAENRQYELMRAGVEEQRAAHEAQMNYNQTKLEFDILQTKWDHDFKIWQANQPNIRVGDNGETVIQQRDAQGNITIKRSGFKEALQFEIARERAKAIGGKRGEYQLIAQAAESGNAIAVVDGLTTRYIGEGLEHSLLTPTSAAIYEEKKKQIDKDLLLQRLPKETFETIRTQKLLGALKEVVETGGAKAEAYRRQMLGLGNPLAGNSLSPEQPKAKQSFTSGGYLPKDEPPPNPFSSILGQQPDGAY